MNNMYERLPQEVKDSLRPVKEEEIIALRLQGKNRVVVKLGEELYVARMRNGVTQEELKEIIGKHLCSTCKMVFNENLCKKVFDATVSEVERMGDEGKKAVSNSKRIEKYPFISKGVERFNSPKEFLIVSQCSNYQKF